MFPSLYNLLQRMKREGDSAESDSTAQKKEKNQKENQDNKQ